MDCNNGKIRYASRQEAKAFARRSKKGADQKGARPYRCPDCGFWHLGRKVAKHVQRDRRRWLEGQFNDERTLDRKETP